MKRFVPLGAAALVLAAGACTADSDAAITGDTLPWVPASAHLASYDTCDAALAGLQQGLLHSLAEREHARTTLDGGVVEEQQEAAGSADAPADQPGAETTHSTTNNAVTGVDEPDLVKTDGRYVYAVAESTVHVVDAREAAVVAEHDYGPDTWDHRLFLGENELLVLYTEDEPGGDGSASRFTMERRDPATLERLDTFTLEGTLLDARMIGGEVRLAVGTAPDLAPVWERFGDPRATPAQVREAVRSTDIEDWLPTYTVNGEQGAAECDSLAHPERFGGDATVTVVALDAAGEWTGAAPTSVLADGGIVHGTAEALYLAHGDYRWDAERPEAETEIYRFAFEAGQARLDGEGAVPGTLLNQYSMSEHDGHLRVATTEDMRSWWGPAQGGEPSRSTVTVLAVDEGLAEVGSVTDLGPDERIYSVRFIGDTGYVVTFRETDPLYTVDLSDPAAPVVTGELKITGYSAYLHPVADDRLLGVGQEATEEGFTTGLQVSLFDVSEAAATVADQWHREGAGSAVEWDPHGFLYWAEESIAVLPVQDGGGPGGGAVVLTVADDRLSETAWIEHPGATYGSAIVRSLVIDDQLWTVSEHGLQAVELGGDYDVAEWIAW